MQAAVQKAVDACSTVHFPTGYRFAITQVALNHSNLHLRFARNASLVVHPPPPVPGVTSYSSGGLIMWCSGCIYENVSVVGEDPHTSMVDGQGWRQWHKPEGSRVKTKLLTLHNVRRVCVKGMLFKDSPTFHVLVRGDRVSVLNCRVEAGQSHITNYKRRI